MMMIGASFSYKFLEHVSPR